MRSTAAIVTPLCSAVGYVFAAMMLKKATSGGGRPWRVVFIVNLVTALSFQFWFFYGGESFTNLNVVHAVIAGTVFFAGQILTFVAISQGDVSISTPVLGTKVVFVALFVYLFGAEPLSPKLWMATLLTSAALILLGGEWRANRKRLIVSVAYAFFAAILFAVTDVLQRLWVPAFGFGHFAPVMFLTVGVLSVGLIPFFGEPLLSLPAKARKWALLGGGLLSVQNMGIAYCIGVFREVTITNVLYNTRGLWSVLLVWVVGHWFANTEKTVGGAIMTRRLMGALLLLAAVYLSLS